MLKKYTTEKIRTSEKCVECGKRITIAHIVNDKIVCSICKKKMQKINKNEEKADAE